VALKVLVAPKDPVNPYHLLLDGAMADTEVPSVLTGPTDTAGTPGGVGASQSTPDPAGCAGQDGQPEPASGEAEVCGQGTGAGAQSGELA